MHTLIAVLVAAAAACAIPRPPEPTPAPAALVAPSEPKVQHGPSHDTYLGDYMLPKILLPHYAAYDDGPRALQSAPDNDWLNKEIDRISQMESEEDSLSPYDVELARWYAQGSYIQHIYENQVREPFYNSEAMRSSYEEMRPLVLVAEPLLPMEYEQEKKRKPFDLTPNDYAIEQRKQFALTPLDKEYYQPNENQVQEPIANQEEIVGSHEGELRAAMMMEPPRQTRQNPNLSKQKHLLEPDLEKLKTGLSHEDGELSKQHHVHVLESADPAESIYGVALIAAVGAALAMAIVGFAFGWYTLSKKAKAAADVDYPAYGVTGPTMDSSGDRKLAHSAHMYHYQHQKQQIIAMERNGMDQRAGSVSDPESEEENEEGDYTVYECPGFATTGDMEVKNPLFTEDPTPASPGKCEVVKPQPKD
ncbi:protein cab-1 isoform X1 [Pectinophora gossypiella]|uniref:protein cab-1 isoform X1 n=1 Tax=Pectinophora gossypiella TaxID=13191 RepID=UPI00214EA41E|nr:protein cab-1 isoform X1 [Pectinophora gossypiella]